MPVLRDIIYRAGIRDAVGELGLEIRNVSFDSRHVVPGDLFVAVRGSTTDGHAYISEAAAKGAIALVYQDEQPHLPEGMTAVRVDDSAYALGTISSEFYGSPSQNLVLIGVTGTNGKTTVATLLHRVFSGMGYPSGLLSTIENRVGETVLPATHTTPDPVQLNRLLSEMVKAGISHCFMEVSSHAIDQRRIAGLTFRGGIFTNLTRDHLDYHGSFDKYRDAKKAFFDSLGKDAFALVNADDKNGKIMLQNCRAAQHRYSLRGPAEFRARVLEHDFSGMKLDLDGNEFWTQLIGRFNAYNLLAVYGASRLSGIADIELLPVLSRLGPARGRFEYLRTEDGITAVLDYAHTPDALRNVLETIREIRTGAEQLLTVIGAGGNRDKGKRPLMGQVAAELSDKVILTSDNPRNEDPDQILDDILEGIGPHLRNRILRIADRREAIRTAAMLAKAGDIILVAGKGHETYQEINGVRQPFDDLTEIKNAFGIQN